MRPKFEPGERVSFRLSPLNGVGVVVKREDFVEGDSVYTIQIRYTTTSVHAADYINIECHERGVRPHAR